MTTIETEQPELQPLFEKIDAFIKTIPNNEMTGFFMTAAAHRNTELLVLLSMAQEKPYPWRKELRPISHEINEFIKACEVRNERPLVEDPEHPERLEEQIALREETALRIEQSRLSALCMLAHLNMALECAVPQPANLKAV